ncbi:MAG TPA: PD-(D/E)XK nuclease domain-containing protein [Candidatus Deferrimicrobium sp.]|nr:PD-(D/E)XK nuclease domain-containing protein [Candidatus Deferrimicrobium sp.]
MALSIRCFDVFYPYNIQIENREAYYHSLVYVALKISMMDVQAEIQTALGRSDIVVSMDRYIYIIEFKMGSAQTALDQIEEKVRAGNPGNSTKSAKWAKSLAKQR